MYTVILRNDLYNAVCDVNSGEFRTRTLIQYITLLYTVKGNGESG